MKVLLLSLVLLVPALPLPAEGTFLKYLFQSANQGEAESQFVLGLAHRDGWDGAVKTGTIAAKWCELAAELGDQRPLLVLGLLQQERDLVVLKDEDRALKLLGLAADQGDDYARVILGDMLLEGDGVPVDWQAGSDWIKKSANTGFVPAQFRLGLIYMVGNETTPKDDVESLAWFIVAAEGGSKPAQEFREERTQQLGREIARLAILRSRTLLVRTDTKKRPPAELVSSR